MQTLIVRLLKTHFFTHRSLILKSQQNRIELVTRPDRLQDFRIHPLTGDVTVARLLDREVRDEYALKVQATDGAWKLETVITGECST